MKGRILTVLIIALGTVLMVSGCGSSDGSGQAVKTISGAGSTFVFPVLQKWIETFQKQNAGISINYQPKGSGAGIAQFSAGTVDFGATDAPLNDSAIAQIGKPTIQFPIACGCVALSYNIKGVGNGLKLSSDVIADIFLGKITSWSDPRIASQNPGVSLPSEPITTVHRSDSSGTTYIFSSYLSAVSPVWKTTIGADKSAKFPVGIGGPQSSGVASQIKQNEGSIGYVELAYVKQTGMPVALIKNAAGSFVEPSLDGTQAAESAMASVLAKDLRTPIVNAPGAKSYPIAGYTYALVGTNPGPMSADIVKFFTYCIDKGQPMGATLDYAALPDSIIEIDKQQLAKIQTNSK